jgi:acyl-CoA reductase-like NAD-dependent aldehyde dehydrogenase
MSATDPPHFVATPIAEGPTGAVKLVRESFERMREAQRHAPAPSYAERCAWLDALLAMLRENQPAIEQAVSADFGGRSCHETRLTEIFFLVSTIKYVRAHLRGWMKPRARSVPFTFLPGRAKVFYQPLGIVGVIAPWNYPFQLALGPVVYALAAGNRVLVKPSEYTPHAAALLHRLIGECFGSDVMQVVIGGAEVGEAFSHLPFDHLLFTGSTPVGRMVMRAAAENLVPVTLELGGKSPVIVHQSFSPERAAVSIAFGKWLNAGQTCIAPDYVLVHESQRDALVDGVVAHTRKTYPTIKDNPDYTSVISPRHYQRLRGLIEDAQTRGARTIQIKPQAEQIHDDAHRLPPTVLLDVRDDMKVMQEEIFGPVLPIITYRTLDDAIAFVNNRPRPLALYYFDDDASRARSVLERTTSGGAVLNDTMMHFGIDDLPFGGVGGSGMGAYHGIEGFETFSHKKGTFVQSRVNGAFLLSPPYGQRINRLLKLLIG